MTKLAIFFSLEAGQILIISEMKFIICETENHEHGFHGK